MGFLCHNFCSRHARRSIKGSIHADDHEVSTKILSHNNRPMYMVVLASAVEGSFDVRRAQCN